MQCLNFLPLLPNAEKMRRQLPPLPQMYGPVIELLVKWLKGLDQEELPILAPDRVVSC